MDSSRAPNKNRQSLNARTGGGLGERKGMILFPVAQGRIAADGEESESAERSDEDVRLWDEAIRFRRKSQRERERERERARCAVESSRDLARDPVTAS